MPDLVASDRSDTPTVALGPTALVLGAFSAVAAWVPALVFVTFPWAFIAGALAVTFGAWGIYHARQGTGRLWTAVAGTTLGAVGCAGTVALLWLWALVA
ncbi:hypothetical protein [Streptomyces sp. NBC_01262]|uniref:hypothetical protein n=1 Tax=Streptomyces sp. NBC_01262 TaxID=2903803 RepID=UPI002E313E67|nr:hypothetical protein [Streptomyces sp. NBC_01262]